MEFENYDNLATEFIEYIDDSKVDKSVKEEIIKYINTLSKEHRRVLNYYDLNTNVLEEEKKILLDNFIKKDADANYLYNTLEQREKELNRIRQKLLYRIYAKIFRRRK